MENPDACNDRYRPNIPRGQRQPAFGAHAAFWEETRDGITVVVEPKPHWAEDMRVFHLEKREYCRYTDWAANGGHARFYGHIDTSGDDVMMGARVMIAREIADGLWD
ncbi:hypothetical protein [Salipiger bermudensis]|uniref:hypothetical protein n=1 Tax=Salipiger bermudensis TaxID=344736 RepID=UPI003F7E5B01